MLCEYDTVSDHKPNTLNIFSSCYMREPLFRGEPSLEISDEQLTPQVCLWHRRHFSARASVQVLFGKATHAASTESSILLRYELYVVGTCCVEIRHIPLTTIDINYLNQRGLHELCCTSLKVSTVVKSSILCANFVSVVCFQVSIPCCKSMLVSSFNTTLNWRQAFPIFAGSEMVR